MAPSRRSGPPNRLFGALVCTGRDADRRRAFAPDSNARNTRGLWQSPVEANSLVAGAVGVAVGALSGYIGGWLDNVLMRIVDAFFAIPFLFVILVAARFFGDGQVGSIIAIFGLLSWPLIARLVRASYLSLRETDYVLAARAVGIRDRRIIFRHILPNAIGPVIVAMTLLMGSNIVLEAFVSYLNFGIGADQTSWGNALSNAQNALILGNWWWAFFPGMAIALTVIAINFIGDGLRDALDPRTLVE
ncbi:MAG: ABC transporter permease [Chloroflexi bacterium]|nr:MAG: ABC transporter permease [Chloroflexota bacterium]